MCPYCTGFLIRPGASFTNITYTQKKAYAAHYAIIGIYKKKTWMVIKCHDAITMRNDAQEVMFLGYVSY